MEKFSLSLSLNIPKALALIALTSFLFFAFLAAATAFERYAPAPNIFSTV